MNTWHIVTCEYPPQIGGVSDYTGLLAEKLVGTGDAVHVWAPMIESPSQLSEKLAVHPTLGRFDGPDLSATQQAMQHVQSSPRDILVQYVPHGYGHRSMNLAFCKWIESLAKRGDRIHLMVHEPFLESGQGSWKQRLAAQVHRRMARILLRCAHRVLISIPAWERYLLPYAPPNTKFEWLPIPATLPVTECQPTTGKLTFGHLGTYSTHMRKLLSPVFAAVLRRVPECCALLLGRGSAEFVSELTGLDPSLSNRIEAAGLLPPAGVSRALTQCSLMFQPFPDGLSSRRTSLMNALAHAIPVVSNKGHLTEDLWRHSGAIFLSSPERFADDCVKILSDAATRSELALRGRELYLSTFDWPRTLATLRLSAW